MKDILVVYFSRSGYTQRVAENIVCATGADREAIREPSSRRGLLGYWRSAHQALRGAAVDIEPASLQPRDYALVVLGTPVWAGNVSAPMRAYIAKYGKDFLRVAMFCTQGGAGAPKVLQKMTALCDQLPVATAFFNDADIDDGKCQGNIDAFCAALAARKSG
jgi:flavodoxin